MNWLKKLFCRHDYKPMPGLMGFFCKVQCRKCGKIDNDFSEAVTETFRVEIKKESE
jgi:ribosomal protein S27E